MPGLTAPDLPPFPAYREPEGVVHFHGPYVSDACTAIHRVRI